MIKLPKKVTIVDLFRARIGVNGNRNKTVNVEVYINPIAIEFAIIEADMKANPFDYFVDYEDHPSRDWIDYLDEKFQASVQ